MIACSTDDSANNTSTTFASLGTSDSSSSVGDSTDSQAEGAESQSTDAGDATAGDGDSTATGGDGDSSTTAGDGDSSSTATDSDSSTTTGDGDSSGTAGDGDSSTTGGDTDSSTTSGDGDSSTTAGDGDSSTTDSSGTGGDGDGDGDPCASVGNPCDVEGEQQCTVAIIQTCTDVNGCLEWVDGTNCADDPMFDNGICVENGGVAACEEEAPCFSEDPVVTFEPPNLVLVLDKSGSMQAAFSGSTRWDVLRNVVDNVTTNYDDKIKFGAKWFPTDISCDDPLGTDNELWCFGTTAQNQNGCSENNLLNPIPILAIRGEQCSVDADFDIAPAIDNHDPIMGAMPSVGQLGNGCLTPTEHAYAQAITAASGLPAEEDTAIMLLLDGAITDGTDLRLNANTLGYYSLACLNDDPTTPPIASMINNHDDLVTAIANAAAGGTNTYVVAIDPDGEGTVAQADQYADAGGVPNPGSSDPNRSFYEANDAAGLNAAMDAIAAAVVTCDISLSVGPGPGIDIDVSVNDGTSDIGYDEISMADCDTTDGWYFSDPPTNENITLCGQACLDFKDTLDVTVDFFCSAG